MIKYSNLLNLRGKWSKFMETIVAEADVPEDIRAKKHDDDDAMVMDMAF